MAAKGTETARTHSDLMCVKRQSQPKRRATKTTTWQKLRSYVEMTLKEIFKPKVFGQLGRGERDVAGSSGPRVWAIVVKLNSN